MNYSVGTENFEYSFVSPEPGCPIEFWAAEPMSSKGFTVFSPVRLRAGHGGGGS
jgi:hypothetical protein